MKKLTNKVNLNFTKVAGSVLTAGFLMFGTATFAQERENVGNTDVDEFGQYDANQDMNWDREEFDTRMSESGTYDQWDTDRSGDISEDEFNEGTYNQWDADRDGMLTNDEYNEGINTFEGSENDLGLEETGTEIQNETQEMGTEIGNEAEEVGNEMEETGTEIGNEMEETGTEIGNEVDEAGTEIRNETEEVETETETQY